VGAAGRLGVLLFFFVFFWVFFDDGMGWGGAGWDVKVHVTLMALR
jgi:hypothetical protein